MQDDRHNIGVAVKLMLVLSFVIPFGILYFIEPGLFERTWIGRTFYLFFLWLVVLEIVIDWSELGRSRIQRMRSARAIMFIIFLTLPTLYVVLANYQLNAVIGNLAAQSNVAWPNNLLMRISIEYLVFTILSAFIVLLAYGTRGLGDFSAPILFLGSIGALYTMDNLYPVSTLGPFQFIVFTTASLAAGFLGLAGYQIAWAKPVAGMPAFMISDSLGRTTPYIAIGWPCAGIESLLIYTVVMLLFLKKMPISWAYKLVYFVAGAFMTYLLNGFRIMTIFIIFLNGGDWQTFHDYYGMLYSVIWITLYPLIVIGIQALSRKIRNRQPVTTKGIPPVGPLL